MEKIINNLGSGLADACYFLDIVHAGAGQRARGTKMMEQRFLPARTDERNGVQLGGLHGLAAFIAMGTDGKAVRLVAQPLKRMQNFITFG